MEAAPAPAVPLLLAGGETGESPCILELVVCPQENVQCLVTTNYNAN